MSGIIDTPKTAKTVATLSLADRHQRESIRVPCRTPEKGWEAVEMQEIYALLDDLMARRIEDYMPIGHVIVQYPSQPEPDVLYPNAQWQEISNDYAGDFFRVAGGNASDFGSGRQEESAPNIEGNLFPEGGTIPFGSAGNGTQASGSFVRVGETTDKYSLMGTGNRGTNLLLDASRSHPAYGRRSEVAPANQTIRIWQKIG